MKTRKIIIPLLIVLFTLSVCFLVISTKCIGYKKFIGADFLFAFIGVLIGFALSLFTHVVGLIGKLKDKYSTEIRTEEITRKINALHRIYDEMKDDIVFMFISLVVIVIISIISGYAKFASKQFTHDVLVMLVKVKESVVLAIFLLNIYTVKDLISISFKLSEYVVLKD